MNMNLSSSEDEGYSSNDEDISEILQKQQTPKIDFLCGDEKHGHETSIRTNNVKGNDKDEDNVGDGDESDGFSNVDWEDASVEDENEDEDEDGGCNVNENSSDSLPATKRGRKYPTRGVTIHFGGEENRSVDANGSGDSKKLASKSNSNTKTKGKRKRIRKIKNLSSNVRALLEELQRAHILSSIGRSIFHSSLLGSIDDEDIWSTAYSLIPLDFLDETTCTNSNSNLQRLPTYTQVQQFSNWFFDLVNHIDERRWRIHRSNVAAGAPTARRSSRRRGGPKGSARSNGGTPSTKTISSMKHLSAGMKGDDNQAPGVHSSSIASAIKCHLVRICSYLSMTDDDHPDPNVEPNEGPSVSPLDKVLLFVCMARGMGWRVRFVKSILPMDNELTEDHPIFVTTMRNTFQSIVKSIDENTAAATAAAATTSLSSPKKRKRKRQDMNNQMKKKSKKVGESITNPPSPMAADTLDDFVWLEVLCTKNNEILHVSSSSTTRTITRSKPSRASPTCTSSKVKKQQSRWIHIDPNHELFDKPSLVENIDFSSSSVSTNLNKKKSCIRHKIIKPVSYVVAVEHTHYIITTEDHIGHMKNKSDSMEPVFLTTRLTDITPRYANKWSLTLKLRGATAKDLSKGGGKCPNAWWSGTIKKVNRYFLNQRREYGLSDICKYKDEKRKKGQKKISPSSSSSSPFKVEKCDKGRDVLVLDDTDGDDYEEQKHDDPASSHPDGASEDEDSVDMEEQEFASMKEREAIPTSKAAFKNHPLYVIPSVLKRQEVLAPDSKRRMCGMFKGELVYQRKDVSIAHTAKKWPYIGRKVKKSELSQPAKVVKARKKPMKKGFQALTSYGTSIEDQTKNLASEAGDDDEGEDADGKSRLYGKWQTLKWSPPPVGPNDPIPVNEHKNVELQLINPGLVHLELRRIAYVAKRLSVPYAPCLLGFEGHGGNRTPTVRGIVVHEHNVELLYEAHLEWESQAVENEYKERQRAIYGRWKKLIFGMMTKERLEREYANA